jgi:hypothetical protein
MKKSDLSPRGNKFKYCPGRLIISIIFALSVLYSVGCGVGGGGSSTNGQNTKTIDGWTIEQIEPYVNAANGDINVVIDGDNKLHVSYWNFDMDLKYATNKSGSWKTETVASPDVDTMVGENNSIAVELDGTPHISYHVFDNLMDDVNREAIVHATKTGGAWLTETVFSPFNNEVQYVHNVIKIGDNNTIHIAAHQVESGGHYVSIKYAYKTGGQWNYEVAASDDNFPNNTLNIFDMELDSSGIPHIIYATNDNRDLYTSDRAGPNMWASNLFIKNLNQPIIAGSGLDAIIDSLDLAIGNNGERYLILFENSGKYYMVLNSELNYLDSDTSGILFPRILVDRNGNLYYMYFKSFSYGEYTIFVGTNKTGKFIYTMISGFKTMSPNAAFAVDNNGEVYIVYQAYEKNELNVAHKVL